jgi:hypothetical protein
MHTSYLHKILKSEVGIAKRTYNNAIDEGRI